MLYPIELEALTRTVAKIAKVHPDAQVVSELFFVFVAKAVHAGRAGRLPR